MVTFGRLMCELYDYDFLFYIVWCNILMSKQRCFHSEQIPDRQLSNTWDSMPNEQPMKIELQKEMCENNLIPNESLFDDIDESSN